MVQKQYLTLMSKSAVPKMWSAGPSASLTVNPIYNKNIYYIYVYYVCLLYLYLYKYILIIYLYIYCICIVYILYIYYIYVCLFCCVDICKGSGGHRWHRSTPHHAPSLAHRDVLHAAGKCINLNKLQNFICSLRQNGKCA